MCVNWKKKIGLYVYIIDTFNKVLEKTYYKLNFFVIKVVI